MKRVIGSATFLLLAITAIGRAAPAAQPAPFAISRRIPVGGDGGWDLLSCDNGSHRLFIAHSTRVVVIDAPTGKLIGEIPGTNGVHGVALAPALGRGFTSNGRDSTVTVFDLASLATLTSIKLDARNPDAIAYDEASGRVFAFNAGSASASVIDASTNAVVGTVALGGKPELAVTDGAGRLFVNLEDSSTVAVLDTRKLQVLAKWPLAPGEEPTGLAIDRKHHRLFAACGNEKLVVLDAVSGARVAVLPIGKGVDGVAFDALRGLAFTSNGEGTMTVILEVAPDRFRVLETVVTERGARTIALDESTGEVYLPTADFGPPPAPTSERPNPRPPLVPGSFRVLVVKR